MLVVSKKMSIFAERNQSSSYHTERHYGSYKQFRNTARQSAWQRTGKGSGCGSQRRTLTMGHPTGRRGRMGKGDQRALRHRGAVGCPGRANGQARRGTGHHEGYREHRRAAEGRAQQRGGAAAQGGRHLAHLGHQAAHLPQAAVRHRRGRHTLPHARAAPCDDTVCRQHLQGVWHHAAKGGAHPLHGEDITEVPRHRGLCTAD